MNANINLRGMMKYRVVCAACVHVSSGF